MIHVETTPPDPAVSDTTKEVVEGTIDLLSYATSIAVGVAIGLVIAFIVLQMGRLIAKRHLFTRLLLRRITKPMFVTLMIWCGRVGMVWYADDTAGNNNWVGHIDHILIIMSILCLTWLLAASMQTIEDITDAHFHNAKDPTHKGRIATQAQLLRRLGQLIVITVGIAMAILTFPAARVTMASLLGAAGLLSVVAAVAAQTTLGNVFAGIQLAITDAIRVGDVVLVPGLESAKENGRIEEITLTYVVLALWDERRIIIPSSQFTNSKFENWTKRKAEMLGTVELLLDYSAPITQIRERVDVLLNNTDLWDHRTANVQVTDSTETTMKIRIVMSAADSGNLWDLRCYMREELVEWINIHAPYAWPRQRYQKLEVQQVEEDLSDVKIAELAEELAHISGREIGRGHREETLYMPQLGLGEGDNTTIQEGEATAISRKAHTRRGNHYHTHDPVHRARLKAAQQRAQRELMKRQSDHADHDPDKTTAIELADRNDNLRADVSGQDRRIEQAEKGSLRQRIKASFGSTKNPDKPEALHPTADHKQAGQPSQQQSSQSSQRDSSQGVVRIPPTHRRKRRNPLVYRYHDADTIDTTGITDQMNDDSPEKTQDDTAEQHSGTKALDTTAQTSHTDSRPAEVVTGNVQSRLFSGSPDAEQRGQLLHGPGDAVWADRKEKLQQTDTITTKTTSKEGSEDDTK
ncbi:MAG: mechanosensitive ion channel [Actinomycetaceae bacterium]|nr:mechanosensitive ion channel [Actinomycetaceae bacterium]